MCYGFKLNTTLLNFQCIQTFLVFMMFHFIFSKPYNVEQMCNFTTNVSSNFLLHKLISFIVMHYMSTPQKFFNHKTNFWQKECKEGSHFLHSTAQKQIVCSFLDYHDSLSFNQFTVHYLDEDLMMRSDVIDCLILTWRYLKFKLEIFRRI